MDGAPNTSATPDLPAPFHPLLATYAASRAYFSAVQEDRRTMAAQYDRQFQSRTQTICLVGICSRKTRRPMFQVERNVDDAEQSPS